MALKEYFNVVFAAAEHSKPRRGSCALGTGVVLGSTRRDQPVLAAHFVLFQGIQLQISPETQLRAIKIK